MHNFTVYESSVHQAWRVIHVLWTPSQQKCIATLSITVSISTLITTLPLILCYCCVSQEGKVVLGGPGSFYWQGERTETARHPPINSQSEQNLKECVKNLPLLTETDVQVTRVNIHPDLCPAFSSSIPSLRSADLCHH